MTQFFGTRSFNATACRAGTAGASAIAVPIAPTKRRRVMALQSPAATGAGAPRTRPARSLRRRREHVVLLVHVARDPHHQELERRRAGVLECFRLAHANRNGIARLD